MKRKIISALAAGILMFTLLPQAFASQLRVEKFTVDSDTQIVTVSGTVTGAENNQMVTLRVLYDEDNTVNYITQKAVEVDGRFLITYKMNGVSGMYTAHINTKAAEADYTKQFKFTESQQVKEVIAQINAKTDANSLYAYISDAQVQAFLQINWAELTGNGSVLTACELIIKEKTVFATASQFVDMLTGKTVLVGLNEANYESKIIDLISRYPELLKIAGTKRYEIYNKNSTLKDGVATRISLLTFANETEFSKKFEEQVALEQIKQVSGYGEVYDILINNNDLFALDFSIYNRLSGKNAVLKSLAGNGYEDAGKLKTAFDKACKEQEDKEKTPIPDPGKKGGGGGSSPPFINPGSDVKEVEKPEVEKPIEPTQKYFSDLNNHVWAEEGINFLYEKGVVAGDGTGFYYPANHVTREEFIKMLAVLFDFENGGTSDRTFTDVGQNEWYANYVYAAVEAGVLSGYPDGTFGVGENISREDIAVILNRALEKTDKKLAKKNAEKVFTDAEDIAEYAKESVAYMQTAGIINGFEGGEFAPKNNATRAETARILYLVYTGIH